MTARDLPSFETDLSVPVYRPMRRGAWNLRIVEAVLCPGVLVEAVARRWMRGRWLPGTKPPF